MTNEMELWAQIKSSIVKKNSTNKPLLMWFDPTDLISIEEATDGNRFYISVPSELHRYWLSQNLLEMISVEISALYQKPFNIELQVVKSTEEKAIPSPPIKISSTENSFKQSLAAQKPSHCFRDKINPDYTFSTFVVGRNNEFAHAASFNIAENPGAENYNPLFICGPTGMGKTHLLNAVGSHIMEKFPKLTIHYCSAEKFLNDCISSIRRNEMHKFRARYRDNCHLLLMDDIQVLGRGEAVQEEFFHTLNDFFDKGQQVVVASDRMPKDISGLEDRIRTRLEWGLIADIQMPDIETRVAILRYKAEIRLLDIPQDVIHYVARISKRSIRELEGNLNKVKMYSELQGLPINLDLTRKVLASHDETVSISIGEIQRLVSEHFNVRIPDLKTRSRTKPLVTARQTAMFLIKKYMDKSLVDIGRAFGGKDHTTVINAIKRITYQQSTNPELRRDIEDIESRIHIITGV